MQADAWGGGSCTLGDEALGGDAGPAEGMWPWHEALGSVFCWVAAALGLSSCPMSTAKVLLSVGLFLGTLSKPLP